MSTIELKKLRVLERLAGTYDEKIIDSVLALLNAESSNQAVPLKHFDVLEEEHQKYLRGELQTDTWEDVESRLKGKYGL